MLSDITSSEGILARYSDICKAMKFETHTNNELHRLIKNYQKLSNQNVRNRHIQVMRIFDLIQLRKNKAYKLFTHGKTIIGFEEKIRPKKRSLSSKERVLYLAILSQKAKDLVLLLLERLNREDLRPRQLVIIEFFKTAYECDIWPRETIDKGLQMWSENQRVHRSFENRFRCIEMWLEDLELVTSRSGKIAITPDGFVFREKLRQEDSVTLRQSIEIVSNKRTEIADLNSSVSYRLLREKILGKYDTLLEPTGFVDVQAMYEVTSIELGLEQDIFFQRRDLPLLLKKFWQEGLISSLSKDTNGLLRYLVLKI